MENLGWKFYSHFLDWETPLSSEESSEEDSEPKLPSNISTYITDHLIPKFVDQRNGFQFAVVILLSEKDYQNIKEMSYTPSDEQGNPITDVAHISMPQCKTTYCNYIVARPIRRKNYHAEIEIFGNPSTCNSNFKKLWDAYQLKRGKRPDYILIFSWILPCSNCTEVIIESLKNSPYNEARTFVGHVIDWRKEPDYEYVKKFKKNGIIIQKVNYDDRIQPRPYDIESDTHSSTYI